MDLAWNLLHNCTHRADGLVVFGPDGVQVVASIISPEKARTEPLEVQELHR